MNFLSPGLLGVLIPALALPLIAHLLSRGFPRRMAFSSLRHLRATVSEQSRLYRWRHRLLMALRTLALLALLLAFLRPVGVHKGAVDGEGPRFVLIVLDNSLSMEHRAHGSLARTRALQEAEKVIASLGAGDKVNVLRYNARPETAFVDFSLNHAAAKRFLSGTGEGNGSLDATSMQDLVAKLVRRHSARTEVHYISDFQRSNWSRVDFRDIPATSRIFFLDVGADAATNRAVLSAELQSEDLVAGQPVVLEIELGNFSDAHADIPLRIDLNETTRFEKQVAIAPWSVARTQIPLALGSTGEHRISLSLPADELAVDNHFELVIPVREREEVAVLTDHETSARDAHFFLTTALNPYDGNGGRIAPRTIAGASFGSVDLAGVKKLFMTQAGPISPEQANALAEFVFGGGGIVCFLDGDAAAENLRLLGEAMGEAPPLRLGEAVRAENLGAETRRIMEGEFDSPLLRLFRNANRSTLAQLEVFDFYQASATGNGQILLRFDDGTPAMATCTHGLGRIVLFNFSASELSSNLARQPIFPAWIQDIVVQLTPSEPVKPFQRVGDLLTAEVWVESLPRIELLGPDGQSIKMDRQRSGSRIVVSHAALSRGLYTLKEGATILRNFAVNPAPEESDLRALEADDLPRLTGERSVTQLNAEEDLAELVQGYPLFHYFILAACVCFALEGLLQISLRRRTG